MVHKRIFIILLMVILPAMSACQSAADSKSQFCNGLRALEPSVTQLVEGKEVANAGQLKQSLVIFRDALSLVVSQASQVSNLNLDNLIQALEDYETQVKALPDETPIAQVMTSVGEAAGKFKGEYEAIAGTVCATD